MSSELDSQTEGFKRSPTYDTNKPGSRSELSSSPTFSDKIAGGGRGAIDRNSLSPEPKRKNSLYKRDSDGWEPITNAEQDISDNLTRVSQLGLATFSTRDDLSFLPTDKEFRYFSRDGTTRPAAGTMGVANLSTVVIEKDKDTVEFKSANVVSSAWGAHTTFQKSSSHIHDNSEKTSEVFESWDRKDPTFPDMALNTLKYKPTEQIKANVQDLDCVDGRQARNDRINKVRNIFGAELFHVDKAIDINNILIDGDVVEYQFNCSKVTGLPPIGNIEVSGTWTGRILVAYIKNTKLGRDRIAFSVANGTQTFSAQERFDYLVNGMSHFSCSKNISSVESYSTMELKYEQSSKYKGATTFVPVPTEGDFDTEELVETYGKTVAKNQHPSSKGALFSNCIAYRITNKNVNVVQSSTAAGGFNGASETVLDDCAACCISGASCIVCPGLVPNCVPREKAAPYFFNDGNNATDFCSLWCFNINAAFSLCSKSSSACCRGTWNDCTSCRSCLPCATQYRLVGCHQFCSSAERAEMTRSQSYTFSETDVHDLESHPETFSASGTHPLPHVNSETNSQWQWKMAPVPCCCFQYMGVWSYRMFPLKDTNIPDVQTKRDFPSFQVEKKVVDDVVVEFMYKSIPNLNTTKLVMHLETNDLPAGKTADDIYAFAQNLVSVIGVKYGEAFKQFEHQRSVRAENQAKLASQYNKQKEAEAEAEAEAKEERRKAKAKKAQLEAEKIEADELKKKRELQQYEDDKSLRDAAREQVMFEKDFKRRQQEEMLQRNALERQLLDAGKTIVRERCQCTDELKNGKVPGTNWLPFSLNLTSGADASSDKKKTFSLGLGGGAAHESE